jgi:hypothetical protein
VSFGGRCSRRVSESGERTQQASLLNLTYSSELQTAKQYQQLIEIVANFPKELVIANLYVPVSYLISSVKREFRVQFL